MNKKIYETENFILCAHGKPHVTRLDGGHIYIDPKTPVLNRTYLSPKLATELMRFTMIAGEAMSTALNKRGIDIGRINYQDNGNWGVFKPEGPHLHIQLYGRAKSAKINKWGQACNFPNEGSDFYNSFEPLNDGDIEEIKKEINEIFKQEKYSDRSWDL